MNDFENGDIGSRLLGIYEATVTENADPEGRGRIRAIIPGLIDEQACAWAGQKGSLGRRKGTYRVPPLGAHVLVQFVNGDPDRPIWEPGEHHEDEQGAFVPTDADDLGADEKDQLQTLETERWSITLDDRAAQPLLRVKDKVSGDMVEFDGKLHGVTIKGSYMVRILADAMVDIDAPSVKIKGRLVLPTTKPI